MAYIPDRLRESRFEKGWTQAQVVAAFSIHPDAKRDQPLTNQQISIWEQPKGQVPHGNTLAILADILDVSADWLLGRCNHPKGRTTRRKAGVKA